MDANAFALALAAREAAEAVARAEATLAQAQAEAYADGIVSVEEQARLDEAAANWQQRRRMLKHKLMRLMWAGVTWH